MKVTSSTGVILDSDGGDAPLLTRHAKKKKLKVLIFHCTFPDNSQEYLILDDKKQPIHSGSGLEPCACFLDMLAIDQMFDSRSATGVQDAVKPPRPHHARRRYWRQNPATKSPKKNFKSKANQIDSPASM